MATTSDVKIAEGSGKNVAAYSVSEDSETKQLQRVVLCDSTGAELNDTTNHLSKVNLATKIAGEDSVNDALKVEGLAAEGATTAGNPLLLGAKDDSGNIRQLLTAKGALNSYTPTDGKAILATALFAGNKDNGWKRIEVMDFDGDANAMSSFPSLTVYNWNNVFNGASWDRLRTSTKFKTATATASGNTAVWTPTSGKKFRLMKFLITIPQNAAISGGGVVVDITFQDATTDMGIGVSVFIPQTAITTTPGGFQSGWIDLGNGILSAAANNVLNINLSAALTTSKVRVSVAGTEE